MAARLSALPVLFALSALALPLSAQNAALPDCDPPVELRKALDIDYNELGKLPYVEQMARQRTLYEGLVTKYPEDVRSAMRLVRFVRYDEEAAHPGALAELQRRFKQEAEAHPDDPFAQYRAAYGLIHSDTPEAIRIFESERTKWPQFPWPAVQLADIYSSTKFGDKQKAGQNLEVFLTACPTSDDSAARWTLNKYPALQVKTATALRASLARETDPDRLRQFEYLWGLEFRSRPPQEHDAERKQITADLKRLEAANPKPDSKWQAFLINGYKQSGAAPETVTAMEDRLVREYPHSDEAFEIVSERWTKEHKDPESQKDTAAWQAHDKAYEAAVQEWIRQFPDNMNVQRVYAFYAIEGDDSVGEKEGLAVTEEYVANQEKYSGPDGYGYLQAGQYLLEHNWQPAKALGWLEKARDQFAAQKAATHPDDEAKSQDDDFMAKQAKYLDQSVTSALLLAALRTHQPDAVQPLRAKVEGPAPTEEKELSGYWEDRARLAAIDGRRQDAMSYYQMALHTRMNPPQYYRGQFHDQLGDEAQALWKGLGGTEVAWNAWSAVNLKKADEQTARWEKPKLTLPTFALTDLSGKTWKLPDLKGKVVMLDLWATWCGPCNAELPQLQKLYERLKTRNDVQILTFDIDEDLGLVAPFVKEKGYTFPVLPASSYVTNLLPEIGIPQIWLVDANGNWQWTQVGYGSDDAWVEDLVRKLDSMKAGG